MHNADRRLGGSREIDALVARDVMGEELVEIAGKTEDRFELKNGFGRTSGLPYYSTIASYGMDVVQQMGALGFHFVMNTQTGKAGFLKDGRAWVEAFEAIEKAPLAICRAALRAVSETKVR